MTRQCPNCGNDVAPPRVYCRLSCRIAFEHREMAREPRLFADRMARLETDVPSDATLRRGATRPRTW